MGLTISIVIIVALVTYCSYKYMCVFKLYYEIFNPYNYVTSKEHNLNTHKNHNFPGQLVF